MTGGLFGSGVLEIAIGVSLMFLFASLICTAAREVLEQLLKSRGNDLERGVRELLGGDCEAAAALYANPLVSALYKGGHAVASKHVDRTWVGAVERFVRSRNLPSYIPCRTFADAVIGQTMAAAGTALAGEEPVARLRRGAEALANPAIKVAVLHALDMAGGDLARAREELEGWFNGAMDRVSGWYKRRTQLILMLIGLAAAILLNLDPITITQRLSEDAALRGAVVAAAAAEAAKAESAADVRAGQARVDALRGQMQRIGYPMGWDGPWPGPQAAGLRCQVGQRCVGEVGVGSALRLGLGWAITALAIMLGAPFWFDVLNKFMVIRSTVKPTQKSPDEASADKRG